MSRIARTSSYHRSPGKGAAALIGSLFILLACSPAPTASTPSSGGAASTAGMPVGPKTLRIAEEFEYPYVAQYGRVPSNDPNPERYYMFHANLAVFDNQWNPVAHLAQKIPTIQDGDWKVNPDGTMEVTWKIRPDAFWQDGVAVTADDFVFGYEVAMDPALVVPGGTDSLKNISALRAADAKTLVVDWKVSYIYANANNHDAIPLIPRHQIEPIYRSSDPVTFEASQVWRSEFLGAGPFRITETLPGNYLFAEASDRFFLGRPKIDRLEIYWMPIDVMVARVLSGAIDLLPVGAHIKPNQLVGIRAQMGGNWGTAISPYSLVRNLKFNFREGAVEPGRKPPWAEDLRFRQAITHSLDRAALIEAAGGDLAATTSYNLDPEDPTFKLVEQAGIPKFPYNPTLGQQLLAQAGWTKGPDGLLRNSAGQTVSFPCCRYANAGSENVRESLIWGDALKTAGLDVTHPLPNPPAGLAGTDLRRAMNFGWGGQITNWNLVLSQNFSTITSAQVPNDSNRWTGVNNGAYSNSSYDNILAERLVTIPLPERRQKEVQLIRIMVDELPVIPVYYNPSVIFAREGITGPARGAVPNASFHVNIHTWDIK